MNDVINMEIMSLIIVNNYRHQTFQSLLA